MDFKALIQEIVIAKIIQPVILLIGTLALVYFLYGVAKYIQKGGDDKERGNARQMMIYGIIGLAVMVSVWGLVNLVAHSFFPSGAGPLPIPKFQ